MPFKTTDAKRLYDRERYLANRGSIRIHQAMRRAHTDRTGSDVDNGYRRGRRDTVRKLKELFESTYLWNLMTTTEKTAFARLAK